MDNFIVFTLKLLESNDVEKDIIINDLINQFDISEDKANEVINYMIEQDLIEEVNLFEGITLNLTENGHNELSKLDNKEIDYKSLLGDMCFQDDDEDDLKNEEEPIYDVEVSKNNNSRDKINEKTNNLSDFSSFQIKVKRYSRPKNKTNENSGMWIKQNVLEFVISIILVCISTITVGGFYLALSDSTTLDSHYFYTMLNFVVISLLYPIVRLLMLAINPNKKRKKNSDVSDSVKLFILLAIVIFLLDLSINFLFGLTLQNYLKYLPNLIISFSICFCVMLYPIIKILLLKLKKFTI